MKTKVLAILVAGAFIAGATGVARAFMVSPQKVVFNSMGSLDESSYSAQNMIDHSGLVADFTSGVTELSTYLESADINHATDPHVMFVSPVGTTSGYIDFDLGGSYELTTFLLWNDKDTQGINTFQLFIDDDESFTNPKELGPPEGFYASYGYDGSEIPMQQFQLNKLKGRYVRLYVWGIFPTNTLASLAQVAEIAFDAAPASVDDVDADSDGVIDDVDACVGTIDDYCPCDDDWANHGKYVNCVEDFVAVCSMSEAVRGEIISEAAHSTCGQKDPKNKKH